VRPVEFQITHKWGDHQVAVWRSTLPSTG